MSWLHLIGAIVWIGGSIFILFVLVPTTRVLEPAAVSRLNKGISKRFAPISMGSVVLMAATGIL